MAGAVTVHGPRAMGQGTVAVGRVAPTNNGLACWLGLLACWFPCANLPSGAIGDQAGTARLPGSASFLQGSTVPFHSYWRFPPSFLRRAYSDPPHHGLEPPSIKLCFLRSVDSQQFQLNYDCQSGRIECTTRSFTMNSYSNHADSDFLQGCLTT